MKNDFENYLRYIHGMQYEGLDDDMPDDFDNWVTDLQIDDVIKYANAWGKEFVSEYYN